MTDSQVKALIDVLKEFQKCINEFSMIFHIYLIICVVPLIFLIFQVSKLDRDIQKIKGYKSVKPNKLKGEDLNEES